MRPVSKFARIAYAMLQMRQLGSETIAIADGVVADPDPEDSAPASASQNSSEHSSSGQWVWDLITLAEELEHIAAWGQLSPTGVTQMTPRALDAIIHRIPEIAHDLTFYYELLSAVEAIVPEQGLWRRLCEEIRRALKGPGYEFGELRSALYSVSMLAVAADAERSDGEDGEDESIIGSDDFLASLEDDDNPTHEESEGERHSSDEERDDSGDDEGGDPGDSPDGAPSTRTIHIIDDQMVSRGMMLLHLLRVPLNNNQIIAVASYARQRARSALGLHLFRAQTQLPRHLRRKIRSFRGRAR